MLQKKKATAQKRKPQAFSIQLRLDTECFGVLTESEVMEWLKEKFAGCDMGKVTAEKCIELKKTKRQPPLCGTMME